MWCCYDDEDLRGAVSSPIDGLFHCLVIFAVFCGDLLFYSEFIGRPKTQYFGWFCSTDMIIISFNLQTISVEKTLNLIITSSCWCTSYHFPLTMPSVFLTICVLIGLVCRSSSRRLVSVKKRRALPLDVLLVTVSDRKFVRFSWSSSANEKTG